MSLIFELQDVEKRIRELESQNELYAAEMSEARKAGFYSAQDLFSAYKTLEAQLAELKKGEPVAWTLRKQNPFGGNDGIILYHKDEVDYCLENEWQGASVEPLYSSPAIPKGYQLVPVEPTENMLYRATRSTKYSVFVPDVRVIYKAMLSACKDGADS